MFKIRFINLRREQKKLKKLTSKAIWQEKKEEIFSESSSLILNKIKEKILASVKNGQELASKLTAKIKEGKLIVDLPVSYAPFLNYGTRPHLMEELTGKVIPITIEGGRIIFRTASRSSMARGKWKHPGTQALLFWETGIVNSKEGVKHLVRQLPKRVLK